MIGFCCYFTFCLLLHCFVIKKEAVKRQYELTNYIMYFPSRISFIVWGPWLATLSGTNLNTVENNIALVDEVNVMNKCLDQYSRVDTDAVSSELNEAKTELNVIYVTFWVICALFCAELVVWIVYGCYYCMERSSSRHLMRNHCDSDG